MSALADAPRAPEGAERDLHEAWARLGPTGLPAAHAFAGVDEELVALRAVARGDLGLARVLDGHRNALDRLLRHRPDDVPRAERARVEGGGTPLGVWGADPGPGEGEPARLVETRAGLVVRGTKTFCSGAGFVERALVLVRGSAQAPPTTLVHVALDEGHAEVDREWFGSPALATSLSHRVVLHDAPVLAVLGRPGALSEEPWISHDALRTAATWVGALDAVVDGALRSGGGRTRSDAEAVAATTLERARRAAGLALEDAGRVVAAARREDADDMDRRRAAHAVRLARLEIAERADAAITSSAALAGSRPLVAGAPWARARADLDLLLRQHRLAAVAVAAGHELLGGPGR